MMKTLLARLFGLHRNTPGPTPKAVAALPNVGDQLAHWRKIGARGTISVVTPDVHMRVRMPDPET